MVQAIQSVLRARGCQHCRVALLRAFTTIAGRPSQAIQLPNRTSAVRFSQKGAFSTTTLRSQDLSNIEYHETIHNEPSAAIEEVSSRDLVEVGLQSITSTSEAPNAESTSVPWYLQVEPPARTPQPYSDKQKIPELPESSPAILQPLLEQLSVDLGMDDLTILDLRELDPPPALGANLLMLIGTARSEKHLHVSADRLCRWLRSNYKLRPDADGLLGRNELKLKLKRKARRAKLMGNKDSEDMDDGVRTGWVCVNVGTVEGAVTTASQKQDFVGFGRRSDGIKIVVQMLVEEKRQEIDLERLWLGISKRQVLPEIDDDSLPGTSGKIEEVTKVGISESRPVSASTIQSRGYHTSTRQSMSIRSRVTREASDEDIATQPPVNDLESLLATSFVAINSGDYNNARLLLVDNRRTVREFSGDGWRKYMLQNLKRHLESVSPEAALQKLGVGQDDRSSTPFLLSFYQAVSFCPGEAEWEYQVWLHCFARELNHPRYFADGLKTVVDNMQHAGTPISMKLWLAVIRSLLKDTHPLSNKSESQILVWTDKQLARRHTDRQLALDRVVQIMQTMQSRGENIMEEDVFVAINDAIAVYPDASTITTLVNTRGSPSNFLLPARETTTLQKRLNQLMFYHELPIHSDHARVQLLHVFARQYDWHTFWSLFRSVAREGKPRSAELYATMFSLVAETGHQKACMSVLRNWIAEMDREDPSVPLEGIVRDAVETCLRIVDAEAEAIAMEDADAVGEWVVLWRRCLEAEG